MLKRVFQLKPNLMILSVITFIVFTIGGYYLVTIRQKDNHYKQDQQKDLQLIVDPISTQKQDFKLELNQSYISINQDNTPEITNLFNYEKINIQRPSDTKILSVDSRGLSFIRGGDSYFDGEKRFMIAYPREQQLIPENETTTKNYNQIYNDYWYILQDSNQAYPAVTDNHEIKINKIFVYELRTFDLYPTPTGNSPLIVRCSGRGELEPEIRANCNHIIDNLGVENLPVAESIR
ncbi:MAG: hypothetical protein QXP66_04425 [Candidatus Aenigmatarchaeota archaeon]